MKKFYSLFVLALLALTAQAQDDLTWWGYYTNQQTALTGTYGLGDYEVAMFIPGDGDMKGVNIEAIRAQTRNYSFTKDFKFWIRTSLDGENIAEAIPAEVTKNGTTTATFTEAVAIPETGVYVGYSFNVYTYDDYEYFSMPVVYAKTAIENSFYLKKPGESAFNDKSSTGSATIQVGFKAPATTMWWGNYTGSESTGLTGNYKLGIYEAAMFVAGDGDLAGADIKAVRAQARLYSNAKDFTFWIRTALDGENVAEATPTNVSSNSWTEAEFASAYAIPASGCYVGYTFNLASWYSDYDYTPIVYAKKNVENGFFLKQPEETAFTDKSSTGCLVQQIEISSSSMTTDAAQVADDLDDMVAVVGTPISVNLTLTNQGSAGVQSIDYTYTLDGEAKEGHADLATPIEAMLGAKGTVSVELGTPQQAGQQEIEIQITKVNGNDNGITGRKSKCSVVVTVLSESAPRKAVAEIFYNAGNGYAARAIVGSQLLNQQENVIAFLIDHYSGALAVKSYAEFQKNYNATSYTNKYSTYPVAEVNRAFTTDPYTGATTASNYGANHFAAAEAITPTLSKATEASVAVTAQWTDDTQSKAAITATTKFMADFRNAPYRLAFVVIKDNVKETISNYITYSKNAYADDDMEEWRTNPYTNPDYVLNNVAVASSDVTGIIGSVPTRLTAGEEYTYEYELEVPAIESQEEATNARVVALLINKDTKEIVNAEIVAIKDAETEEPEAQADVVLDATTLDADNSNSSTWTFQNGYTITNASNKAAATASVNTLKYSRNVMFTINVPADATVTDVEFEGYTNGAWNGEGNQSYSFVGILGDQQFNEKTDDKTLEWMANRTATYGFPANDEKDADGNQLTATHKIALTAPQTGGTIDFQFWGTSQVCAIVRLYLQGTTTGIDAVVPAKPVAETIYNLSGQRVDASYKGLVIMNGRKVVIK